jgi:4-hydroxy-2-oxoheptanedioate aldolase
VATNRVRERWRAGGTVLDCWLSGTSMTTAESIGRMGYDSVIIDMQHTMADFGDVARSLIALTGTGTAGLVRVPGLDPFLIQRLLDNGADGVLCPMINNAEQAAQFVGAIRYPPMGYRSVGAYRAADPAEYFDTANGALIAIAQIETVEAMENLEAIAATEGLDVLFSGPADMSVSYGGRPAFDSNDPTTAARHQRMAKVAHAAGKKAGMLALRPHDVPRAVEWGMDFISVAMESRLVTVGAAEALARAKAVLEPGQG